MSSDGHLGSVEWNLWNRILEWVTNSIANIFTTRLSYPLCMSYYTRPSKILKGVGLQDKDPIFIVEYINLCDTLYNLAPVPIGYLSQKDHFKSIYTICM